MHRAALLFKYMIMLAHVFFFLTCYNRITMARGTSKKNHRIPAWGAAASFFVLMVISELTKLTFWFQALLYNPLVASFVTLIALASLFLIILWIQNRGDKEHVAMVRSILIVGTFALFYQWLAPTLQWWKGTAFGAPTIMQGVIFGGALAATIAFLLVFYRFLAKRSYPFALLAYTIFIVVLTWATITGEQKMADQGIYVFGNGYTLTMNILYEIALFTLPISFFEYFRKH